MSEDMSMFKKMKERITDEVNSATNKLQNMQLIDQLASSIGQQARNDMTPNQLLPQPQETTNHSIKDNNHFSLLDGASLSGYNEEEELNSEISPQHQLFHENAIRRLDYSVPVSSNNDNSTTFNVKDPSISATLTDSTPVINIHELSSDIEDNLEDTLFPKGVDDSLDVEIDLLSDKPIQSNDVHLLNGSSDNLTQQLLLYKTRYKNVVHAFREMHLKLESQRSQLEFQSRELSNQLTALKLELDNMKQQQAHSANNDLSLSVSSTDNDKSLPSPHQTHRSNTKLKDLERLLAKCKESLKLKNTQIQTLKESLGDIERFKDYNEDLKRELRELREAHETWTISIAENKRIMHQEIEQKNLELENLRGEIADQQTRLNDSQSKIRQAKLAIQDLESRLVSTSAAHQKERESLTKELNASKNMAIRNIQKEHELHLERVKLDLEKSIEALKLEAFTKDEQLMKTAEQHQHLREQHLKLSSELEDSNKKLQHSIVEAGRFRAENQALTEEQQSYVERIAALEKQVETLNGELSNKDDLLKKEELLRDDLLKKEILLSEDLLKKEKLLNQELARREELLEREEHHKNEEILKKEEEKGEIETITPDSTQFEYLKNIVYQFMLGKEPLVLARVISAVFKFDKNQVDQICRVQESLQASNKPTI